MVNTDPIIAIGIMPLIANAVVTDKFVATAGRIVIIPTETRTIVVTLAADDILLNQETRSILLVPELRKVS